MQAKHVHALMCAFEDMFDEIEIRVNQGESLGIVLRDLKQAAKACQETLQRMRQ